MKEVFRNLNLLFYNSQFKLWFFGWPVSKAALFFLGLYAPNTHQLDSLSLLWWFLVWLAGILFLAHKVENDNLALGALYRDDGRDRLSVSKPYNNLVRWCLLGPAIVSLFIFLGVALDEVVIHLLIVLLPVIVLFLVGAREEGRMA